MHVEIKPTRKHDLNEYPLRTYGWECISLKRSDVWLKCVKLAMSQQYTVQETGVGKIWQICLNWCVHIPYFFEWTPWCLFPSWPRWPGIHSRPAFNWSPVFISFIPWRRPYWSNTFGVLKQALESAPLLHGTVMNVNDEAEVDWIFAEADLVVPNSSPEGRAPLYATPTPGVNLSPSVY